MSKAPDSGKFQELVLSTPKWKRLAAVVWILWAALQGAFFFYRATLWDAAVTNSTNDWTLSHSVQIPYRDYFFYFTPDEQNRMEFALQLQFYIFIGFAVYSTVILPEIFALLIALQNEMSQGNEEFAAMFKRTFRKKDKGG